MVLVMSPSGLATYKQCPLRYFGQSVEKSIPWVDSPAKARGTEIHNMLEKAAWEGQEYVTCVDDRINADYARSVVQTIEHYKSRGYILKTEHEMAMTKQGQAVDWWSDKAFLRAKADVLLISNGPQRGAIIGDWKTGKVWDRAEHMQLRLEALLVHILYGLEQIKYSYWYVDQGEAVQGELDFSKGLADVQDLYALMGEFRQSVKNNYWPARQNRFCRWCPWHKTENCKL